MAAVDKVETKLGKRTNGIKHCFLRIFDTFNLCSTASDLSMDRNFWAQACNTSANRPLSELRQDNIVANVVAVSCFALPDFGSRRLLTPSSDFVVLLCCRVQRDILFAGL